jgi:hypothetical protein
MTLSQTINATFANTHRYLYSDAHPLSPSTLARLLCCEQDIDIFTLSKIENELNACIDYLTGNELGEAGMMYGSSIL